MRRAIEEIRQRVSEQKYPVAADANEEMADDELTALDIEQAILTGKIEKKFTRDPRGTRYEIAGRASDGRPLGVVCRTLSTGWLRIITVYAWEKEEL